MKKLIIAFLILNTFNSCEKQSKISTETFNPEWKVSFPGIWESEINQPEDFNLLSVANKAPRIEALNKKSTCDFPVSENEIKVFIHN